MIKFEKTCKKLKKHIYANCKSYNIAKKTYSDDGTCIAIDTVEYGLVSYNTTVIRIKNHRLIVTGLYSITTRKHVNWWLDSCFNAKYNTIKQLATDMVALDMHTGEVLPLTPEELEFIDGERRKTHIYG